MQSVFLGDPKQIKRVYAPEAVDRLRKRAALLSADVYCADQLPACKDRFRDVECVFSTWGMPGLDSQQLSRYFPKLKFLFYAAGSVQSFARPFFERGVRVFSARAANAVPVAEYAAAQILLANKGFLESARLVRQIGWDAARETVEALPGNYGSRVGLLGAGEIGRRVIGQLRDKRLEILVYDPFLSDQAAHALGVAKAAIEDIFSVCQTVSNHMADVPQTRNLLDYALFSRMRPHAVFLNTGRGAQVNEEDLVRVLRARPDITAVLDVTQPEPPAQGHPFYTLPNVVLTPHIAGSSGQETFRMGWYMVEAFEAVIRGETSDCEVTPAMLETMA